MRLKCCLDDDKPSARLIVSRVIVETMKSLQVGCRAPAEALREELHQVRRLLAKKAQS